MPDDEIRLDDFSVPPIRMTVSNLAYRNAAGIGFTISPPGSGLVYAADFSELVFRKAGSSPMWQGPGFRDQIPVNIDLIDRVLPHLIELSGSRQIYEVSEAERRTAKGHVDDLRDITKALLDMQRVIIGRTKDDG